MDDDLDVEALLEASYAKQEEKRKSNSPENEKKKKHKKKRSGSKEKSHKESRKHKSDHKDVSHHKDNKTSPRRRDRHADSENQRHRQRSRSPSRERQRYSRNSYGPKRDYYQPSFRRDNRRSNWHRAPQRSRKIYVYLNSRILFLLSEKVTMIFSVDENPEVETEGIVPNQSDDLLHLRERRRKRGKKLQKILINPHVYKEIQI